jgi:hypothetical protein
VADSIAVVVSVAVVVGAVRVIGSPRRALTFFIPPLGPAVRLVMA